MDASLADTVVFQASDLSQKRREFIDQARIGGARLRDTDGTSLVMVRGSRFEFLDELATWTHRLLDLHHALRQGDAPTPRQLGDLAWLRFFDGDDRREFATELEDAMAISIADGSLDHLHQIVDAWRTTADTLEDPLSREVLLGHFDPTDFVDAPRPE